MLLVEGGILASILDLEFIDARPSVSLAVDVGPNNMDSNGNGWYPTLTERFEQALYPVSALLSSLLSTHAIANTDVIRQSLQFLHTHTQAVVDVLQDNNSNPSLSSIKLIRVWASIFYTLAPHIHHPLASIEIQRVCATYKELLLLLAHKYVYFPEGLNLAQGASGTGGASTAGGAGSAATIGDGDVERAVEVLRLRQSLMGYFRRALVGEITPATTTPATTTPSTSTTLLFTPQLQEDCSKPPTKHTASLSLLAFYVYHSQQCLVQLAQCKSRQISFELSP